MARIIFPEDFLNQLLLLDKVKTKHDSYAGLSPISAFLTQQGIDLLADDASGDTAKDYEKERRDKSNKAENSTQRRNLTFDPVFGNMRDYYQFLKKFYKPNYMQIGEWGAPVTTTGRIAYPEDFPERTIVFDLLKTKYNTYMPIGTSPLDPYLTLHVQTIAAGEMATQTARDLHIEAKQLAMDAEDATQDRNNIWLPVVGHLRAIGVFLMGLYNNNSKELGEWGYTIDDSPRAPKEVVSKVKLGASITVRGVIIGATFKNIGTVPLNVYKGEETSGTFVTVPSGEMYGITKGFSIITIANTSLTTTGVFSVLRSQ